MLRRLLTMLLPGDWTPDRLNLGKRRMYRWNGRAIEHRPMTDAEWNDAYTHWAIR